MKKSSSKSWRKAKSWRKTKSWRKASPSFGEKSWTKILKTKNLRADTILSSGYHTEKWKPKSKFLDRRMFWSFRFLHRRIPDETRASQSDKFYIFYHPTEKLYHIFTKVRNQIKMYFIFVLILFSSKEMTPPSLFVKIGDRLSYDIIYPNIKDG